MYFFSFFNILIFVNDLIGFVLYRNSESDSRINAIILPLSCQYWIWSLGGARDNHPPCALSMVLKHSTVSYEQHSRVQTLFLISQLTQIKSFACLIWFAFKFCWSEYDFAIICSISEYLYIYFPWQHTVHSSHLSATPSSFSSHTLFPLSLSLPLLCCCQPYWILLHNVPTDKQRENVAQQMF